MAALTIYRVQRNGNFTVMANYHLKDRALSLKAKGLFSVLLSLPNDWDFSLPGLAAICKEGMDAIRDAVKELEALGSARSKADAIRSHLSKSISEKYDENPAYYDTFSKKIKEALELYKGRDASEKLCRGDKTYLGNQSMRVYSNESMEAKIFVEFVALIIRNRIYTYLKKEQERSETK